MKISKLYCNLPDLFNDVEFYPGINVIIGEIRHPENREKDTHNLGKSILAQLIDFCLLKRKQRDNFLFNFPDRFDDFVFFLEVHLPTGNFVTIRREVAKPTRPAFKIHEEKLDLRISKEENWDHWAVAFERSKVLLNGILGLENIDRGNFRKVVGYSLRSQKDYNDPFKLAKFGGRHVEWKPYLAHVLGLNAELVARNYNLKDDIDREDAKAGHIRSNLGGASDDPDQLRGLIAIKEAELQRFANELATYNFELEDAEINRELVARLDLVISELNDRRYALSTALKRIDESMEKRVAFNLQKIERIFRDAQVYFGEQITRDFTALEAFNREISEERNKYLKTERAELATELEQIEAELHQENAKRASALTALRDKDVFSKFKRLNGRSAKREADLAILRRREENISNLQVVVHQISQLRQDRERVQEEIRENLKRAQKDGHYATIRENFDRIVNQVIDSNAVLFTQQNSEGNVDFRVDIVDDTGKRTGASDGYTYIRLLCIAFDLAVMEAYLDRVYPHFVYHDGFLETLDDRKKLNLIEISRALGQQGLQHIITLIDSELPSLPNGERFHFEPDEILLTLHDDGKEGRLFKMLEW